MDASRVASEGVIPDLSGLWPPSALSELIWLETSVVFALGIKRELVAPAATRVYLAVYMATALPAQILVGTNSNNLLTITGRVIDRTQPMILSWAADGPAVCQQWWGNGSAAITTMVQQAFYRPLGRPRRNGDA